MKTPQGLVTPQEPQPKLAKAFGLSGALYFKREDLYPLYDSHKGRSIPPMIDAYAAEGFRRFAISSSGNGAIAAALHVSRLNVERKKSSQELLGLKVFVGQRVNAEKLKKLRNIKTESDGAISIEQTERPLRKLLEMVKNPLMKVKSLRQSTDPLALAGYKELAEELLKIPNLRAVFVPSSSGTTAQGLAEFLKDHPVQIHIVQTEQVHRLINDEKMAKNADKESAAENRSLADAIVDTVGPRRLAIRKIIPESNRWIVGNDEIKAAIRLVKENAGGVGKTGFDISPNSALSVAGLQKALASGNSEKWQSETASQEGAIVCLITGN